MDRERLARLFEKVRPIVDGLAGPGRLSEGEFIKMCEEGAAFIQQDSTRSSLTAEIDNLKRRVQALEEKMNGHK